MIGGEPYTLGLFDTAGKFCISLLLFIVKIKGICVLYLKFQMCSPSITKIKICLGNHPLKYIMLKIFLCIDEYSHGVFNECFLLFHMFIILLNYHFGFVSIYFRVIYIVPWLAACFLLTVPPFLV